jgi:hypothetical protein
MTEIRYRFIAKDPDDGHTYLHYLTETEIIQFIQINAFVPAGEDVRKQYLELYGHNLEDDFAYMMDHIGDIDLLELANRVFKFYGSDNIEPVEVEESMPTLFRLKGDKWKPVNP